MEGAEVKEAAAAVGGTMLTLEAGGEVIPKGVADAALLCDSGLMAHLLGAPGADDDDDDDDEGEHDLFMDDEDDEEEDNSEEAIDVEEAVIASLPNTAAARKQKRLDATEREQQVQAAEDYYAPEGEGAKLAASNYQNMVDGTVSADDSLAQHEQANERHNDSRPPARTSYDGL